MTTITIDESDLLKISDALKAAANYFEHRERMNAQLHLASEVRWSPLASEVMAARDRASELLNKA
jgi:hypothetical protein